MKAGRRTLLISTLIAGGLVIGIVLLHSPATHRFAAHLHGAIGGHDVHGGAMHSGGPAATMVGESGPDAAATEQALAGVAAIGQRWDAAAYAETVRLYTAVHREIDWPGVLEPETIRYGADPKQTFDLYRPEQGFTEPGPVFVFIHGNGLGDSDRVAPGSDGLIYSHLGKLGASSGGIGVVMNYRNGSDSARAEGTGTGDTQAAGGFVSPDVAAAGAEDLRLVIEWLVGHIAPYGGDPGTIVVAANSEGATAAAAYLFDAARQPKSGPGVAAAILVSGRFGVLAPGLADLVDAYQGEAVPLALWSAEFDLPEITEGIDTFRQQLCAKYTDCPMYEELAGYNHVSHLMSLGTSDTLVLNALIRFYHTVR